jgi:hypothetical protein
MTGRNDPCPCGSGSKYKKCCLSKDMQQRQPAPRRTAGLIYSKLKGQTPEYIQRLIVELSGPPPSHALLP